MKSQNNKRKCLQQLLMYLCVHKGNGTSSLSDLTDFSLLRKLHHPCPLPTPNFPGKKNPFFRPETLILAKSGKIANHP
jgi:hypothetical protein